MGLINYHTLKMFDDLDHHSVFDAGEELAKILTLSVGDI